MYGLPKVPQAPVVTGVEVVAVVADLVVVVLLVVVDLVVVVLDVLVEAVVVDLVVVVDDALVVVVDDALVVATVADDEAGKLHQCQHGSSKLWKRYRLTTDSSNRSRLGKSRASHRRWTREKHRMW